MLIIGSLAFRHALGVINPKLGVKYINPKDVDIIARPEDVKPFLESYRSDESYTSSWKISPSKVIFFYGMRHKPREIVEVELALPGSNALELLELMEEHYPNTIYAPLNILYMIKMSHRFRSDYEHFDKTHRDIINMRSQGAEFEPAFMDWFRRREKETYKKKPPSLKQSKQGFFSNDGVKYVYDHDSIHVAMAQHEKPAYLYFQPENSEVMCSRDMFEAVSDEIRLNAVLEESYVLALERSQIPHGNRVAPEKSFKMALQKVCSSITSGWFREYAWENYRNVAKLYDEGYVKKFWDAVEKGIVREN